MNFKKVGNKLQLIPDSELEREWVSRLPMRSRKVKPGTEKFVLRAFQSWKAGNPVCDRHRKSLKEQIEEVCSGKDPVSQFNLRYQRYFGESPALKYFQKVGHTECALLHEGTWYVSQGSNNADARKSLAEKLLKEKEIWD